MANHSSSRQQGVVSRLTVIVFLEFQLVWQLFIEMAFMGRRGNVESTKNSARYIPLWCEEQD